MVEATNLSFEQQKTIMDMANYLQLIADISQADIFIDCLMPQGDVAVVVAEAHPATAQSLYKSSVVGQIAREENEPGVLFSLKTGKPVIGSRGITQENVIMQQDIIPIKDRSGKPIAVLIKEKDISEVIQNEKKLKHC